MQGFIPKAIEELALAIYLDSTRYGPENPILVDSYYNMGKLFYMGQGEHREMVTVRYYELVGEGLI